jgi:hypothetical protein
MIDLDVIERAAAIIGCKPGSSVPLALDRIPRPRKVCEQAPRVSGNAIRKWVRAYEAQRAAPPQ